VLVVEHDEETMLEADELIELGPGAGEHGGYVVAQGTVSEFLKSKAVTAQYLNGTMQIEIPKNRREPRSPRPSFGRREEPVSIAQIEVPETKKKKTRTKKK
jgi:excinuclease ABC subunit A